MNRNSLSTYNCIIFPFMIEYKFLLLKISVNTIFREIFLKLYSICHYSRQRLKLSFNPRLAGDG